MRMIGFLVALAVSTTALAQNQWLQMNVVKVKPVYVAEFMDLQKNHISPRSQKQGDAWRAAWRTGVFGNSYTFAFTTPIEKFADYDHPAPLDPEIGAKFSKYVADRESHAFIYRTDLSRPVDEDAAFHVAVVNAMEVAPGRGEEFEAYLKEVLAYMSDPKAGVQGFHVYQKPFGGKVVWWTVLFVENFAYVDGGPPAARVLSEDAMRALGEASGARAVGRPHPLAIRSRAEPRRRVHDVERGSLSGALPDDGHPVRNDTVGFHGRLQLRAHVSSAFIRAGRRSSLRRSSGSRRTAL